MHTRALKSELFLLALVVTPVVSHVLQHFCVHDLRFCFGADGTVGPSAVCHQGGSANGTDLCLGLEQTEHGEAKIVLVPRSDVARVIVFGGRNEVGEYVATLAVKRAAREAALSKVYSSTSTSKRPKCTRCHAHTRWRH